MKLDRTAFKINTIKSADQHKRYWLTKTPAERWAAAWYLTCSAYNIDYKNPPKMEKTLFSMRKNG